MLRVPKGTQGLMSFHAHCEGPRVRWRPNPGAACSLAAGDSWIMCSLGWMGGSSGAARGFGTRHWHSPHFLPLRCQPRRCIPDPWALSIGHS